MLNENNNKCTLSIYKGKFSIVAKVLSLAQPQISWRSRNSTSQYQINLKLKLIKDNLKLKHPKNGNCLNQEKVV